MQADGSVLLSPDIEALLLRYRALDGSEEAVVPDCLVQSAMPIPGAPEKKHQCGPADAVAG